MNDDLLRETFGPPAVAAADLHELRTWAHGRTSMMPNATSMTARELCRSIDPTWPSRGLTNERVGLPPGKRPRPSSQRIKVAESTLEAMACVAEGREAPTTKVYSDKRWETLWPAQEMSWRSWVNTVLDMAHDPAPEIRSWSSPFEVDYVHPARFMMAVRTGGTPYLDAVAEAMGETKRMFWKFGATIEAGGSEMRSWWFDGLVGFKAEWLADRPLGEYAMWIRSACVCGWFSSHQIAKYIGIDSARSCAESWIGEG